ncbi:30S ribosomal protein S4 [Candidatus Woesearchaeota archaeon]|nr:30S ribosomal protein S4 [Candidatus Woesearchaeota archaeon]
MGDPRRLKKTYETPAHPWQKERLETERILFEEYGLKNKREVWKAGSILRRYTSQAKKLILATSEQSKIEEKKLLEKLYRYNLTKKDAKIDDVLSLNIKNILDRRLQSIIYKKNLALTIYQSRQFITHGHVLVNDQKVDVPSYSVSREEEAKITIDKNSKVYQNIIMKQKKEQKEIKEEKEVVPEVQQ